MFHGVQNFKNKRKKKQAKINTVIAITLQTVCMTKTNKKFKKKITKSFFLVVVAVVMFYF